MFNNKRPPKFGLNVYFHFEISLDLDLNLFSITPHIVVALPTIVLVVKGNLSLLKEKYRYPVS